MPAVRLPPALGSARAGWVTMAASAPAGALANDASATAAPAVTLARARKSPRVSVPGSASLSLSPSLSTCIEFLLRTVLPPFVHHDETSDD